MLILHLGCSMLAPSIRNIEMFLFSKTLRDSAAWMSSIANKEAYRLKNALNTACKHSFILCRITKLKIILNPRIYEYVNIFLLNAKSLCHCTLSLIGFQIVLFMMSHMFFVHKIFTQCRENAHFK